MPPNERVSELNVGLFLFPNLTQLDLTGPYEVFARLPKTRVFLLADALAPVPSERGLALVPDTTLEEAPQLDILCVPGGPGVNEMMEHEPLLGFLQERAPDARYVTSVCTGSLVLGAAGLLVGYRATTHWLSMDLLRLFGAEPVDERIAIDRNRITGGGVTAGIDFALTVAAEVFGLAIAQEVQLMLEYSPQPPFAAGSPGSAPGDVVTAVVDRRESAQSRRRKIAERTTSILMGGARGSFRFLDFCRAGHYP